MRHIRSCRHLLAAALLLLAGGCADIDRQLYSLSETVAPADRVTGQRSLNFASRQEQIANSNKAADAMLADIAKQGKPVNEKLDAAQYARLQRIFTRVHAVSHLRDESWKVFLLPSDEFNAFVTGGSYIFVNKGLMDALKSDDEVAAVVGHELAHVSANHVYERNAYAIAATLNGSKSIKQKDFQAAFTYKNEEEADRIGTLYAALAGYDPQAAADVWQKMYAQQGDFSAMTIDHPTNSDRYRANQQLAQEYRQYYQRGRINPQAPEVLASLGGGGAGGTSLAAGQGGGLLAVLETTADAMSKHAQAKNEQARQLANQKFIQYVNGTLRMSQPRLADAHTVQVPFMYGGTVPVANMNLLAQLKGASATDHAGDRIVRANTGFTAEFKFPALNLTPADLTQIKVGVVHAEQAR